MASELIVETFPSEHSRYQLSQDFKTQFPSLYSIVGLSRRWDPGTILKACFYGGSEAVNRRISTVAKLWLDGVNLSFDFIDDDGKLRDCNVPDVEKESQIRIGFSCRGSWALLGTEATDPTIGSAPTCAAPAQTVNLSKVQVANVNESSFNRDVLHELGHVLGFYHEHMRCDAEYDSAEMVSWLKQNLNMTEEEIGRQFYLPSQASDRYGSAIAMSDKIDTKSIEFYSMPAIFFKRREASPCYVSPLPVTLSDQDRAAAQKAYPFDAAQIVALRDELKQGLEAIQLQITSSVAAIALADSIFSGRLSAEIRSDGMAETQQPQDSSTNLKLDDVRAVQNRTLADLRAAEALLKTRLGR
ncbi:M12 family metallopeptidase [Microvirga alba]|uniref:Peptidase M12A domain-containing protein n=1 Tax=Microvirga alba TaxID=2791025 RepID=A0A931BX48_9HYPH|nr:M12 family metallopeptidase [Microvirga alba]MBF9234437.1 hypothetical protein [Microvirga alba]